MVATIEEGECQPDDPSTTTYVPPLVTITPRTDKLGAFYLIEITGIQGQCVAEPAGLCQIQAHCGGTLTDALDPKNAAMTLSYSWTFTNDGFTGVNSANVPPGKGWSRGCKGISKAVGTRR